jgi:hypothetical protein
VRRKLTSRKLWLSIAAEVLLIICKGPVGWDIDGNVLALPPLVYVAAEALADAFGRREPQVICQSK